MPVHMLSEHAGYIPGAVNIGVIVGASNTCAMIDTGLNDSNARKALKAIEQDLALPVTTIINTHGHADHFGGNAFVVKRTGASVWAPEVDEATIRYPVLQPTMLFAGADPLEAMRRGFLLAEPSPVDVVFGPGPLEFEGVKIDGVALKGHSPGQTGLLIDEVFFCADVVLPPTVLEKYKIPYLYSVSEHILSLERALYTTCKWAVPGHGEVTNSLRESIGMNQRIVSQVSSFIVDSLPTPKPAEQLFVEVLRHFDAPVDNPSAYFLLHPTIYAFLSHLERLGEVGLLFDDRQLLWQRV
ncbi:MBL fold metallo-hydrolase [soil metagenome]